MHLMHFKSAPSQPLLLTAECVLCSVAAPPCLPESPALAWFAPVSADPRSNVLALHLPLISGDICLPKLNCVTVLPRPLSRKARPSPPRHRGLRLPPFLSLQTVADLWLIKCLSASVALRFRGVGGLTAESGARVSLFIAQLAADLWECVCVYIYSIYTVCVGLRRLLIPAKHLKIIIATKTGSFSQALHK